jgi:hypothetical protein
MLNADQELTINMYQGEFDNLLMNPNPDTREEDVKRMCLKVASNEKAYGKFKTELLQSVSKRCFTSYVRARQRMLRVASKSKKLKKSYARMKNASSREQLSVISRLFQKAIAGESIERALIESSVIPAIASSPIQSRDTRKSFLTLYRRAEQTKAPKCRVFGPRNRSPLVPR